MDPISFGRITAPDLLSQPKLQSEDAAGSFADLLTEAVGHVKELQKASDQELRKLLAGEPVELHQVMLAAEKAGLASQLMMSVRNKVVEAYQEVMRMQV